MNYVFFHIFLQNLHVAVSFEISEDVVETFY